jgi:hypothetical protein
VIEDDSDIRDTAKVIDEALASDEFKGLETALKAVLATNIHKIHNIEDFAVSGEPCGDARLVYTLKYL